MSSNLRQANKKLKELKQALELLDNIENKIIWAQDFTSYPDICQALEPIYGGIESARDKIDGKVYYLEEEISEYDFKLAEFEQENKIEV